MKKKHRFKFDKLIRDKVPGFMRAKGIKLFERVLDDSEYLQSLKAKLIEEAHEVSEAKSDQAIQEELADVLEVIMAICKAFNIPFEAVMEERVKKKNAKGGFENRAYALHIELDSDNQDIEYYLARPEQYLEI